MQSHLKRLHKKANIRWQFIECQTLGATVDVLRAKQRMIRRRLSVTYKVYIYIFVYIQIHVYFIVYIIVLPLPVLFITAIWLGEACLQWMDNDVSADRMRQHLQKMHLFLFGFYQKMYFNQKYKLTKHIRDFLIFPAFIVCQEDFFFEILNFHNCEFCFSEF